ncbi:ABC transporter ATP-binding protein [Sciscionella marina]|uniref:ABC transporter ATP-binding protein n=1 Tax=Sciscionella marina TaxID=508770 RepID=UPI0003749E74|nr:ATP-binding cassette domain-containing protein [Sciscionella marina]
MTLLELTDLGASAGEHELLSGISLDVQEGSVLAVLGESGSGKTTLGLAALGEAANGVRLTGSVRVSGTELLHHNTSERVRARARALGHLPQDPASVLDPVRRCGPVLRELAGIRNRGRTDRANTVTVALRDAGLEPGLARRHPHRLSGGQQQRMALATTLVCAPGLLVLDEPTTGLDPGTKADLLDRLRLLTESGKALLLLTHDRAAVRALADEIAVLDGGKLIEHGPAGNLLRAPRAAKTRELTSEPAPVPRPRTRGAALEVRGLRVPGILTDLELTVPAGATTVLLGASGAGKTTLGRVLAGLTGARGTVTLDGKPVPTVAGKRETALRRAIQYVHQDSRASFAENSGTLGQIAATARWLRGASRTHAREEAAGLLGELGVDPAAAERPPRSLSGGQLQRCALARALLARPRLLVCDEITSGLDPASTTRLLRVLTAAAERSETTLLLIGHDLDTLLPFADRIAVLDAGRCVEEADAQRFAAEQTSAPGAALMRGGLPAPKA